MQRGTEATFTFTGSGLADGQGDSVLHARHHGQRARRPTKTTTRQGHAHGRPRLPAWASMRFALRTRHRRQQPADVHRRHLAGSRRGRAEQRLRPAASRLPLNVTVSGVVQTEDVDYFAVELKKGERLTVEVEGLRLGIRPFFDPYAVDPRRDTLRAGQQRRRGAAQPGLPVLARRAAKTASTSSRSAKLPSAATAPARIACTSALPAADGRVSARRQAGRDAERALDRRCRPASSRRRSRCRRDEQIGSRDRRPGRAGHRALAQCAPRQRSGQRRSKPSRTTTCKSATSPPRCCRSPCNGIIEQAGRRRLLHASRRRRGSSSTSASTPASRSARRSTRCCTIHNAQGRHDRQQRRHAAGPTATSALQFRPTASTSSRFAISSKAGGPGLSSIASRSRAVKPALVDAAARAAAVHSDDARRAAEQPQCACWSPPSGRISAASWTSRSRTCRAGMTAETVPMAAGMQRRARAVHRRGRCAARRRAGRHRRQADRSEAQRRRPSRPADDARPRPEQRRCLGAQRRPHGDRRRRSDSLFTIEIVQPKAPLVRNGSMNLKVVAKRAEGFKAPISLATALQPAGRRPRRLDRHSRRPERGRDSAHRQQRRGDWARGRSCVDRPQRSGAARGRQSDR